MIIYKATNNINNKNYIGQTVLTLYKRIIKHRSGANKNSQMYFISKANKGRKLTLEQIDNISGENNHGYGKRGEDSYGYDRKVSDETKEKLRKINTGKKHTQETKDKCRDISLKMWADTQKREQVINSMQGVKRKTKRTDEHRENLSISLKKYWDNRKKDK